MSLVQLRKFQNNLKFTLTVDLLSGSNSLVINSSDVAILQSLVPIGAHIICTFSDSAGVPVEVIEMDRNLNILRAQENTVDTLWPAGTVFEVRLTANTLMQFSQFIADNPANLDNFINTVLLDNIGDVLTDGINVLTS